MRTAREAAERTMRLAELHITQQEDRIERQKRLITSLETEGYTELAGAARQLLTEMAILLVCANQCRGYDCTDCAPHDCRSFVRRSSLIMDVGSAPDSGHRRDKARIQFLDRPRLERWGYWCEPASYHRLSCGVGD